ncbi:MAG: MFS transporter [Streptosporangiales bacterium]|nr:MFS transporter [Streptosporangiales bacterium]
MGPGPRAGLVGLLVASGISAAGTRVSVVALPWLVLVTTGSAAQTGVIAFAEMLPYVLLQALAAPLVDRFGGRRVSILCDAASVVILGVTVVLYDTGGLPFWALCGLVALLGAVRGPGENAKHVLIPDIVTAAGLPLERGAGLLDGVSRAGSLVGLPLGGVLAATIGAGNALLVDAATFGVAGVLILALVRVPRPAHARAARPEGGSGVRGYVDDMREGLRFLVHDPLLRAIGLMVLATNLVDQAYTAVLLPVWAKTVFGSATIIGLVGGAAGLGALVGNLIFSVIAHRLPRRITFAICFLVAGAPRFFLLAWTDSLVVIVTVVAVTSLSIGAINPLLGAAEFERIPERMRARVLGAVGSLAWAGIPVGGLLGGWLASGVGITWALVAFGTAYLVATLLPFFQPAWRLMDRDRTRPPGQPFSRRLRTAVAPARAATSTTPTPPATAVVVPAPVVSPARDGAAEGAGDAVVEVDGPLDCPPTASPQPRAG